MKLDTRIALFPVAVDLVVLTIQDGQLCVVSIVRGESPFKGEWALPGGFMREGESIEDVAWRELAEETGLRVEDISHLEQLASYGGPARDPRGTVVSIVYLAFVPNLPMPTAGGDAVNATLVPVSEFLSGDKPLAFDHKKILQAALTRTQAKLEYTSLATQFCPKEFTLSDLRRIYEIVWNTPLNPSNFQRKVLGSAGLVKSTGKSIKAKGRPAAIYQAGTLTQLYPPILRSKE